MVNSRPLCYLYSDDVDQVLTPSHLLTGKRLISTNRLLPEACYEENATTMSNRLSYLRTLIQHFQKRWNHEYRTELREFQRNHNKLPAKQIEINDEKLPRNRWKLGEVEELITSKDGHVRACKLRVYTENRKRLFLNRPINKLCYFEVSSKQP